MNNNKPVCTTTTPSKQAASIWIPLGRVGGDSIWIAPIIYSSLVTTMKNSDKIMHFILISPLACRESDQSC